MVWNGAVGILFGVFGAAAGSAFYQFVLHDLAVLHVVQGVAEEKARALGLQSLIIYVFFGAFYTVFHSLLEEYYWRWFVFGQLRMMFPFRASLLISSIGFTAHHIIVLGTYFGYAHPLTWVFALCVGIGGGVWAWMYERSGSLLAPWISHAVIDAAIFFIGYLMIGSLLTG